MKYSIDVIEQANKLLEKHLFCEIDDEDLKLRLAVLGIDLDDIEDMRETGNANEFEEPFDDDWNPYYRCYNSDFQN